MYQVTLDTVEPEHKLFQSYLSENKIAHRIISPHGPAGGHPIVLYIGTKDALEQMIDTQFDDGTGDMQYLKDLIKQQ